MKTLTNIVHSAKFLFYNRELSERTTNVKTWAEVSKFLMLANAIASNTFTIATHFITFACLLVKNAVFTFYSLNPSSSHTSYPKDSLCHTHPYN